MSDHLFWVDLEMTGLDLEKDHIIEVACIITDAQLNIVAQGPHLVIHQPKQVMDAMNEWCIQHHGASGLTQAVLESTTTIEEAQSEVLAFVKSHCSKPRVLPLAGNSVHADKQFIQKEMPQLAEHLHYRIVDVSTVKELCRRWYPEAFAAAPPKRAGHRALDDIIESIEELKYYRRAIFTALPK
ncbi:ribonuclease H-like domain-containing protein [Polychytrium aggregatum]|uniref:ribonuclease H-like domain-containing protein n=1 Tax=Polychytrium aggregatum TaxID=110093 RepID=UPI0022FF267F|nr:ribonuclease H-like domain-containing protein [Polychytrium aggregatum]KAI9193336.1 ribonuclease H-like domain-containing protein [Polychytrium aggregatum]